MTIESCDVSSNSFECKYTCDSENTEPNGLVQCQIGKWNQVYFNEINTLCIAAKKKNLPKLKSSKKSKNSKKTN